jgi:hypothetical protein
MQSMRDSVIVHPAVPADVLRASSPVSQKDLSMSRNCSFLYYYFGMNKLRFRFNKKLDKCMAEEFLYMRGGGIDFGEGIVKTHPQLRSVRSLKNSAQRKKALHGYFDSYYQIHKGAMLRRTQRIEEVWRKREREYITVTENFFDGFCFPRGEYIAYASIIDCNPRFLESKTFQFFYKKPLADATHTIAHELLHFIFFAFIEGVLKKEAAHLSENQLWDISEIFNVIVLGSPRYDSIINRRFVIPYPDHQRYIRKFEKAYQNSSNAEEFIRQGMAILAVKK